MIGTTSSHSERCGRTLKEESNEIPSSRDREGPGVCKRNVAVAAAEAGGAEVRTLPEDVVAHDDEGEVTLYQFDRSYFSKSTNDAGQTVYVVEPSPPEEEIDSIPAGSPSFEADGETYFYVNSNLYVAFDEDGATGFVNGEPEVGAQAGVLPDGTTEIEHEGVTYHQFDMVFFEQVEDENGEPFYEVVDAPGNG